MHKGGRAQRDRPYLCGSSPRPGSGSPSVQPTVRRDLQGHAEHLPGHLPVGHRRNAALRALQQHLHVLQRTPPRCRGATTSRRRESVLKGFEKNSPGGKLLKTLLLLFCAYCDQSKVVLAVPMGLHQLVGDSTGFRYGLLCIEKSGISAAI